MFMEACENLLKVWMTILHESQLFSDIFCKQAAIQIFNTYLKCHLCQPDGNRGTVGIFFTFLILYKFL